jgi:hypothetical protein
MAPQRALWLVALLVIGAADRLQAQPTADEPPVHQHAHAEAGTQGALFPSREASGTAWVPDETPMYGALRRWSGWGVMFHGAAFGQFIYEPGDKHRTGGSGSRQASSVNWGMAMARRQVGNGRVGVRTMLTAEPWTVTDCGFLNLLATGEVCEGDTIHDRQHPHDLFMELAADYDRPLASVRWQIYAGLAGEPALGPPGFPHRPSAMPNPVAPVTHHWLDSSHITFGLVTAGVYQRRWKAEASVFNGREPDAKRAGFDLAPLDSVSARLSVALSPRLVMQVSSGHLNEAEAEFAPFAPSDVTRTTASATYHRLTSGSSWATTFAYGVNVGQEIVVGQAYDTTTHAGLVESAFTSNGRHTWFGRAEIVGKPAHDLHAHEFLDAVFTVGKLEIGYTRQFAARRGMVPGVGGMLSANVVPPALAPRYSGRLAPGFGFFVTLRPARHAM